MALIQINRSNSDPSIPLNPGELFLNLANGNLWGGLTAGNELLLSPVGNASLWIGTTPPSTPAFGALWWDSVGGQLYVWYTDANSSQWVPASNTAGLADAPSDGNMYARENGVWTNVNATLGGALDNIGRNKLHNGLFRIAQRTNTPWTASGYTLDRWTLAVGAAGDTASVTRNTLTDTARASIGDEEAQNALQIVFTGGAGAANQINIAQRIEGVTRLSGKTVIVSFWANASVANLQIGVSANQNFGTGGSPSAIVSGVGQAVTLSATAATWTRQSVMLMLPSAAGKTLGTNNDHQTTVVLWLSSGANNAAGAGNIGVQSGTVTVWGVQAEIALPGQAQPSPVEKLDPRNDLANCQRFYQTFKASHRVLATGAGNYETNVNFPQMRASPTITQAGNDGNANISAANLLLATGSANSARFQITSQGAGDAYGTGYVCNLSADL
jgi:hypothetical protein